MLHYAFDGIVYGIGSSLGFEGFSVLGVGGLRRIRGFRVEG